MHWVMKYATKNFGWTCRRKQSSEKRMSENTYALVAETSGFPMLVFECTKRSVPKILGKDNDKSSFLVIGNFNMMHLESLSMSKSGMNDTSIPDIPMDLFW